MNTFTEKLASNPNSSISSQTVSKATIANLLAKVPPLWELDSYVAVNPFHGYTDVAFPRALSRFETILQTELLPTREMLENQEVQVSTGEFDSNYRKLADFIGPFLASYVDKGISYWQNPWKNLPLWQAFQKWLVMDPAFPKLANKNPLDVNSLDSNPMLAVVTLCQIDSSLDEEQLEKLLFILPGWSSFLRKKSWLQEFSDDSPLPALLAILAFLFHTAPALFHVANPAAPAHFDNRYSNLQLAETEYRASLLEKLKEKPATTRPKAKTRFVFCIDVRSEPIRRNLESLSNDIATDGFAGFFAMPVAWQHWTGETLSHSPALVQPAITLKTAHHKSFKNKILKTKSWVQKIKRTFPSGFTYVESAGFLSFFALINKTLRLGFSPKTHRDLTDSQITKALESLSVTEKTDMASGLLGHLNWRDDFCQYYLITGHGSHTTNNAHEAGLACGACSGQSGELSAKISCFLLNDTQVREQLAQRGISIPAATKFIPALHETVTDEIILLDKRNIDSDYLPELQKHIQKATALTRLEKEKKYGLNSDTSYRRSKDWAEVFPETGLAGCTSFIIGQRDLTDRIDLGGKTFLNSYHWQADKGFQTLELLLTAPVVVGSWINLQYYASTVAPDVFGAGNKLLHTIAGNIGVFEGNHWNLRGGLPLQSVYDGKKFVHHPLRLQVFVEAPRTAIDDILSRHESIGNPVKNEWIHLIAIDNQEFFLKQGQSWQKL